MEQMFFDLRGQQRDSAPDWRDEKPEAVILDEGAMLQRKLAFQDALVAFSMWEKEIRHLETILLIAQPTGATHGPHERIDELKHKFVSRFEAIFLNGDAVMKLPSRKIFESYRKFKDGSQT